jgi:TolB-like protein/tetratricopeptide (TPR) repeat protein
MTENDVLGSWKEIADYLGKEIRTCWRWEKELGLPVNRIDSCSSRSRVFAYKSEIDHWLREKANHRELHAQNFWAKRKLLLGFAGLALFGLVPLIFWLSGRRPASATMPGRLLSIAVLPFVDANGPAHEAYYADGISQEIIRSLKAYNRIVVIPMPPANKNTRFLGKPEVLGRELGLDYVLKGYLSRQKESIFLIVEFFRVKDEQPVWSSRYREPLKNLVAVKDDVQSRVCGTLNIKRTGSAAAAFNSAASPSAMTLENYVKGNFILSRLEGETQDPWLLYHQGKFYSEQFTSADNELAVSLFQQALANDPGYALAYIGLANCYVGYVSFNWDFDIQWLNKAEELLNKAQAITPDLPEYYGGLLLVLLLREFSFEQDKKEQILSLAGEALKRYPNDQQLNSLMGIYFYRRYGRDGQRQDLQKSIECKKRAFWLNPYAFNNIIYAEMLLLNREYDKAAEVCSLAAKLDESLAARYVLGEIHYFRGDLDSSRFVFLSFEAVPKLKFMALYYLAMIAARRGDAAEARKILKEINLLSPDNYRFFPSRLKLASAYCGLGDTKRGFQYLAEYLDSIKASSDRFINYGYIDLDKNFDKFRKDPKFFELLKTKESASWLRASKSK